MALKNVATELTDLTATGWAAYVGKSTDGSPDRFLSLDNFVYKSTNQTIGGVKTFSSFPVTPSSDPTTDYQVANKSYVDDLKIYVPGTQPAIDTALLTLNCINREEAMFEPRLSVGTLTIDSDFTIELTNSTSSTLLISAVFSLTGTVTITFPSDVLCSIPSSIGTWTTGAKTLALAAGTDDIIEMQLQRYSTNSKWLLKVAEVAT